MTKVFFHNADLDGKCSGAIALMALGATATLHGINYGDSFPWDQIEEGETVYMLDFGLQPFSDMARLARVANLVWIDHHKTAIAEYEAQPAHIAGLREIGQAGCELSWRFFFPEREMPMAVFLLGRYDVWDHSDHRTLPFQYGMRAMGSMWPEDARWRELLDGPWLHSQAAATRIWERGVTVQAYADAQAERQAKTLTFPLEFGGLKCIAMNAYGVGSQGFGSRFDMEAYDAALTFGWKRGQWHVGMYSTKPGVDVGQVCKEYGGGGHAGAGGFQCQVLPFGLPVSCEPAVYGRAAYEAYCATTDWRSAVTGDPLPQWDAQKPELQRAWCAAGMAAAGVVPAEPVRPA